MLVRLLLHVTPSAKVLKLQQILMHIERNQSKKKNNKRLGQTEGLAQSIYTDHYFSLHETFHQPALLLLLL